MANKIKEKRKTALMDFKKKLLTALGEDILVLKLFGSQARGDFRKNSDIDILIVLKSLSSRKQHLIVDLTTQILLDHGVDISPHVYSEKDFNYFLHLQTPFTLNIKREGLTL